jgi:hypothetical protein
MASLTPTRITNEAFFVYVLRPLYLVAGRLILSKEHEENE